MNNPYARSETKDSKEGNESTFERRKTLVKSITSKFNTLQTFLKAEEESQVQPSRSKSTTAYYRNRQTPFRTLQDRKKSQQTAVLAPEENGWFPEESHLQNYDSRIHSSYVRKRMSSHEARCALNRLNLMRNKESRALLNCSSRNKQRPRLENSSLQSVLSRTRIVQSRLAST